MATTIDPEVLVERVRRDAERAVWRARNGIKTITGLGRPPLAPTPYDVEWQHDKVRLIRYRKPGATTTIRQPLLLVHSLVSRSYIFDLVEGNSMVEALIARGFDVYLTDWGVPDELEANNTLETYADYYLPRMVRAACRASGSEDLHMLGYCFGGVLSLLYAAGHPHDPVRSFAFVATPVDFTQMGVLVDLVRQKRIDPDDLIDDSGNLPADVVFDGFRLREPVAELTTYVNLWENLWNSEFVKAHQTIGMWGRDHIPFPGVCFKQTSDLFGRKNLLATGRVPLRNRTVDLADITKPALCAFAEKDSIVPAAAATPLTGVLTGSAGLEEYRAPCGHIGLFVGRSAHRRHIPALADWFEKHSEKL